MRPLSLRRIGSVASSLLLAGAACSPGGNHPDRPDAPIDRQALVTRHNPILRAADRLSPLSLGNGEFAFTADITGLQTFPDFYGRADSMQPPGGSTPLVTQAQWGWHTFPNPRGYVPRDAYQPYDAHGRAVEYASRDRTPAGVWLRENPHRLNLAQIGLVLRRRDGSPAAIGDLRETEQVLDLWSGTLTSRFALDADPVKVETWVHPEQDLLAVRIDRRGLSSDQLAIRVAFPYGLAIHSGDPSDWSVPDRHSTVRTLREPAEIEWRRTLDADSYAVRARWSGAAELHQAGPHAYMLTFAPGAAPLELVVAFSPGSRAERMPDVSATQQESASHWRTFWTEGGAIDLSDSTDPRARELERRIVLSQYLLAIQSAGSLPPQETGLTCNSWFGKFHLEMHWWHAAQFASWNRLALLERSLPWYGTIMPSARETARRQGYAGARWPKMVGPDGRDSPSSVGVFLIWQQPHPIYFAELVYRERQDAATLARYRDLVFETAEFMASYATWKEEERRYVLGPPLIPAQEIHRAVATLNPGFELAYWAYGLETAQRWRERLGMTRDPRWERVLANLSPLPSRDGLYVNAESAPETFTNSADRRDHPTLLAPCGMLPCARVDREMMRRTLREVMRTWTFDHTWGWDYPLIAMTAARVGEPDLAIEALLKDVHKNTYLPNGHNYQDTRLTVYLPGNGGLLMAAAMMAAGWDGAPDGPAPGFPRDGGWRVRWEGLRRMP